MERPKESLPEVCRGWGDSGDAERFFSNEVIAAQAILEPHLEGAIRRMQAQPMFLCLQNTPELNFNGQAIQGLGPLSDEAQCVMSQNPIFAFTTAREPLAVLDAWMWAREFHQPDGTRPGIKENELHTE